MVDTQKNIGVRSSHCSDTFGQGLFSIFIVAINNISQYISHFLVVNPDLIKPDQIQVRR